MNVALVFIFFLAIYIILKDGNKKENFVWVNDQKSKKLKNKDIIKHKDVSNIKDCKVGCWYPYNFKLPNYYRVPYENRFSYAEDIWNNPTSTAYNDNENTFFY